MKTFAALALSVAVAAGAVGSAVAAEKDAVKLYDPMAESQKVVIEMNLLGEKGDQPAGRIVAVNSPYGVVFYPQLNGLAPGVHGFHVHVNPDCGPTEKGLGMKAGGHWDPENTGTHSFPWADNGHKGDLPALYVAEDGTATQPVLAPKIKSIEELRNHSIMVHVGGDNHHDHPATLGGGGARMACGVMK